jgi:hypothetical protein
MRNEYVVVVCTGASGEPDMTIHSVMVTEAQYEMGDHYDMAIFEAEELGYEGPFKCFDNSEHPTIIAVARALQALRDDGTIKTEE